MWALAQVAATRQVTMVFIEKNIIGDGCFVVWCGLRECSERDLGEDFVRGVQSGSRLACGEGYCKLQDADGEREMDGRDSKLRSVLYPLPREEQTIAGPSEQ